MMNNVAPEELSSYRMHPLIEAAYNDVHDQFDRNPDTQGYKSLKWFKGSKYQLCALDPESYQGEEELCSAFYFHCMFPTHHFKVCHTLKSQKFIGLDNLAAWLRYNPFLLVLDVACGDGAGSIAVVDSVLRLREQLKIDPRPINIACLGIDKNEYRLEIYEAMLDATAKRVETEGINLTYRVFPHSLVTSVGAVLSAVQELKLVWDVPSIHHAIAIAANVLDLIRLQEEQDQPTPQRGPKLRSYQPPPVGYQLADFYHRLFESAPFDHLHAVSVDTRSLDKQVEIKQLVIDTVDQLERQFTRTHHKIDHRDVTLDKVEVINPERCYWRRKGYGAWSIDEFVISTVLIHNRDLAQDKRWAQILKPENFELAWARARNEMLRESFCDEIELRIFELHLLDNLERLRTELESYAIRGGYLAFPYLTPKSAGKARLRGVNRFEEEILMVALIQVIGNDVMRHSPWSYAYRLAPENSPERGATEFLYQRWSDSWQSFRTETWNYCKQCPSGFVIKLDITSFFTEIQQKQLQDIVKNELQIVSPRIEWLIEHLVSREISEHEPGKGLVQGGLGSGFLANLYLTSIDKLFQVNDICKRRLFRYVDDVVVVGPDQGDLVETRNKLIETVAQLDLEVHPRKTNDYTVPEFMELLGADPMLDELKERTDNVLAPLWILDDAHRRRYGQVSAHQQGWWAEVEGYRSCLVELGVFVSRTFLSRKVLPRFSDLQANSDMSKDVELALPQIPNTISTAVTRAWARRVREGNPQWYDTLNQLRNQFAEVVIEQFPKMIDPDAVEDDHEYVTISRRVRFALNRLATLGFGATRKQLIELLKLKPWTIRNHQLLLEAIARQGYATELWDVIETYRASIDPSAPFVLATSIRAVRELPQVSPADWNRLTELMLIPNEIVSLMASQTWLFLTASSSSVPYATRLSAEIPLLLANSQALSPSLFKNYLLVLSKIDRRSVLDVDVTRFVEDVTVQTAKDIATLGSVSDLLSIAEPEILRMKYYSKRFDVFGDLSTY